MPIALPADAFPIEQGSPAFRRLTLAMLFAGFSTFSLLYSVQPLLPIFSAHFGLTAENASLAVSIATGPMAIAILFAGLLSDRIGRRYMMVAAMFLAGALTLAAALAPTWGALLGFRLLTGLALAGVPAVAMAYVSEEVHGESIGSAMGLYIAGSAIGGMAGRLLVSIAAEWLDWRWALGLTGISGIMLAEGFRRLAPPSQGFVSRRRNLAGVVAATATLLRDRALPWLYFAAFLLMGTFVAIYNFVGYRLIAPPYNLGHGAVGAIFLLYILGSVSSARFGSLASRLGRRRVFWIPIATMLAGVGLTALTPLPLVILGIAVMTVGFFGAHSIASSWVGRRAREDRGQAAALYLFFYYLGGSLLGSTGGFAWTSAGWPGVAGFCGAITLAALAVAIRLTGVPPIALPEQPRAVVAGTD